MLDGIATFHYIARGTYILRKSDEFNVVQSGKFLYIALPCVGGVLGGKCGDGNVLLLVVLYLPKITVVIHSGGGFVYQLH